MTTKIKSGVIAAGAVDASALSDNSITIAHLNCSDGTNGQALVTDGSGTISFADVGIDGIVSSADATAITIDSSENVGIGSSSPVAPLTINDKATFSFNVNDFSLGHHLYYDSAVNDRWERLSGNAGSALYQTAGNMIFYRTSSGGSTGDSVTPSESMRINSSGSVGIGTNNPDHKFHVDAGAPNSSDKTLAAFSSQRTLRDIGFIWDDSESTLGIATLTNHDLVFHTNGNSNERMRIAASGDITMSGTGSLKVPSGTAAERPSSPTAGMMRYNSSNSELEVYTNMWLPIKTEAPLAFQQASTYHQRWTIAADGQSAQAGSGYTAITVNLNFEGNFIVIAKWSHDYMGIGIGYKAGITNANFTGESNDAVGPYGGDVNGDGFDSTVSYMGQYHWPISGGGANTNSTTYYIKHQRAGNTISTHYSTDSASATNPTHSSWTQVQSATISSTDHCKPVWGEASGSETVPLTLLYNDITGGYNAS